jgi:phosphoserine phosphatase
VGVSVCADLKVEAIRNGVISEIVLVNVSGENKPALMSMLTSTLADYQVRVLDIGQAVIHDELSLGMLIQLPNRNKTAPLKSELLERTRKLGAVIRFTDVTPDEYTEWVALQGKPRYIVTMLAGGVAAQQLAAVVAIVERHGLGIDGIRRLSGRLALGRGNSARACVEISLRGELADARGLKAQLLEAAGRLTFDFSVQEDTVYRRNRRLVAFDMDSTLIKAEVIDELARVHGVGDEVAAITDRAMRGEIDFKESFRRRVALLKGLPASAFADVAAAVPLTDGAQRLISALKHFGYRTAIISGGFTYVGDRLKRELGIDYVYANELEMRDGVVTGAVVGEIVDAERKASLLRSLCSNEGIALAQSIAIGDGANDLPMLATAGLGVAFHAKPIVRESASHAISNFGLDSVLYLMGFTDRDIEQAAANDQSSAAKS